MGHKGTCQLQCQMGMGLLLLDYNPQRWVLYQKKITPYKAEGVVKI